MRGPAQAVGCDGVVGSARRPDACGVCGGDNSTCRLVSGLFTRPSLPRVGYHLIATLPRGACNVSVTELKHSRNFLALRRQDGSYVINGNWGISWSGEYEAAGTRVTYRRQDAGLLETVTAPGPLTEPLDIMVLYQQPNPGIKYEYTLPMKPERRCRRRGGGRGGGATARPRPRGAPAARAPPAPAAARAPAGPAAGNRAL
ncbi:hypothetical protein R5R35_011647 [Gryllus longicercus]|uniref:ADAMTS/ADAMTS-like Spacer 1 domain-containing protein n=1 Tax=Gryllus longicercus TaxID=2509291 RepID=A0AAN9Z3B5_9ORTH